ncbi:hypothetical protein GCK32_000847 [Trichostrongylus colubriformis]|uniref:C2H2-type domain-containing protein n=1 Tax=Trichostrongylus colubriformis TaxID=6319 RepID=A0AAN8G587_TRICO
MLLFKCLQLRNGIQSFAEEKRLLKPRNSRTPSVETCQSPHRIVSNEGGRGKCPECDKGFEFVKNLYQHVREVHHWDEGKVIRLKASSRRSKSNSENELPCEECGQLFTTKRRLITRKQKIHKIDAEIGASSVVLFADYSIVTGQLQNWSDFEDWKRAKELATLSHFVIRSSHETPKGRSIVHVCQHARGTGKDVDILALRRRYRMPRRINTHCSAFLNVLHLTDGSVHYNGCFGNVGHIVSTATLPLSPDDENVVVNMLKSGLTPSIILTRIRKDRWDPLLEYSKQPRICLISLKEIKYIAQKRGLVEGRYHKNDLFSLEELLKTSTDIFDYVYRKTSHPTGDGFVLVILTKSGKK